MAAAVVACRDVAAMIVAAELGSERPRHSKTIGRRAEGDAFSWRGVSERTAVRPAWRTYSRTEFRDKAVRDVHFVIAAGAELLPEVMGWPNSSSKRTTNVSASDAFKLACPPVWGAGLSDNVAAPWGEIWGAVERWARLENGWDGDDAPAPPDRAIGNARSFLAQAQAGSLPAPIPYITSDAEFGFRWKKGDGFASVSFADDGHIIAFCREPGRDDAVRKDEPFPGADLAVLFASIRRLV